MFDFPDRLFFSIPQCWDNCLNVDFKELTPEFYYFPEFLRNSNNYDFGIKQNNERVDNVKLPPAL